MSIDRGLAAERFEAYGPSHQGALLLLLVGVAAIVLFGRRARGTAQAQRWGRVMAGAVLAVTGPLRGSRREADERLEAERAELDALKEAKYREIRDAELDHRMGKLSEGDWRVLDRELRAEAVHILRRLDALDDVPLR